MPGNKASWEDIQGRTWTGLSLGVLANLVTDAGSSGAAYTAELVGADGTSLTIDSRKIATAADYVIANQMEGNPLGDKEFPVSLVGKKVAGSKYLADAEDFVKGIREIRMTAN